MHITESGRFCQTSRFRFERIRSCRCLNSLVGENAAFDRTEHFNTAHVRTKRFGNRHAAVSVLVVFEHGDERAQQPMRAPLLAAAPFPVPEKAQRQLLLKPHVGEHARLHTPAKSRRQHVEEIAARVLQRTIPHEQARMLQMTANEAVQKLAAFLPREL